jgi:chromate reductase, NAD(P)H dehydrogenase (quinone)
MPQPRLLLIAGSTAPAATAGLLTAAFLREIAFLDAEATRIALTDYALPLFDTEAAPKPPAAVKQLRALIRAHQAVFLASPSLHGSVPANLRNLLEWLAAPDGPHRDPAPIFALAATAEDDTSAASALADLQRMVTRGLGATLVGDGLAVGHAGSAFDAKGGLDDPRLAMALQTVARETVRRAGALAAAP